MRSISHEKWNHGTARIRSSQPSAVAGRLECAGGHRRGVRLRRRRECLDGVEFDGMGFNFDIELACMLVKSGYSPMEVPVNYVARSFDEGKKINFLTDFFPSYLMIFRCRFGRGGRT